MDARTALAAVLGVGLGLVFLLAPGAVLTAHTAGRLPQDRSGEYGSDGSGSAGLRRVIRAVGVALVAGGLFFAWQILGA